MHCVVAQVLLGTAMAGVGLQVRTSAFRGVGVLPFLVGGAGAALVGGTGLTAALLLARARSTPAAAEQEGSRP